MIARHRRFRFGAVTATASMAAGVAALAFAVKLDIDPLTLTTPRLATTTTSPAADQVDEETDWTPPQTEPLILEAHAVELHTPWQAHHVVTGKDANCVTVWDNHEVAPAKRRTTVLCRGATLEAKPPTPDLKLAKRLLSADLSPSATELPMRINMPAEPEPALQAATALNRQLDSQWDQATSQHPSALPDTAETITGIDPFGWGVSKQALRDLSASAKVNKQG